MNIFVLHHLPNKAAQYHCDKHVVKMILESAQILSTVHQQYGGEKNPSLYRPTHRNHPCTVWAGQTANNYMWLYALFCCLCNEYTYRYGKVHLTQKKLLDALSEVPEYLRDMPLKDRRMTPFALAMPEQYKASTAVQSYRNYYQGDKAYMAKWSRRAPPPWWQSGT